jgi:hypothetical protein
MTYIPAALRALVLARARASCEYCLVHTDYAGLVHEIDHVIAAKHGGITAAENLAYACAQCHRLKGSDIVTLAQHTGKVESLCNPRRQRWQEHCRLDGPVMVPLTPTGRATARLLQLNQLDRSLLRKDLLSAHRYPDQYGAVS